MTSKSEVTYRRCPYEFQIDYCSNPPEYCQDCYIRKWRLASESKYRDMPRDELEQIALKYDELVASIREIQINQASPDSSDAMADMRGD